MFAYLREPEKEEIYRTEVCNSTESSDTSRGHDKLRISIHLSIFVYYYCGYAP
jgi:hypothetical protein